MGKLSFSEIDPQWIIKEEIVEPDGIHIQDKGADKICVRDYYDKLGRERRTERCVFKGHDMVITFEGETFYYDGYAIYIYRDILDETIQEDRIKLEPSGDFAGGHNAVVMPITQPGKKDLESFQPIDPSWEKKENVWSIGILDFFETNIDCWGQRHPLSDEVTDEKCFSIRDEDYYDHKGRKVATEQYLLGQEEILFYKSEYFYRNNLVECRFWDNEIKKIVTTSRPLNSDGTINYGEYNNCYKSEPRPIIAACEPDPRWIKEEHLDSKTVMTLGYATLEIKFYDGPFDDCDRKMKRYEEWHQFPNGEKILVREEIFEERNGKDWFWDNYGGVFTTGYLNYYDYISDREELTD